MTKLISLALMIVASLLTGCYDYLEGYPKTISFPAEGGSMIIAHVNRDIPRIGDYDQAYISKKTETEDKIIVTGRWLTLEKNIKARSALEIIAQPNKSKKPRVLYIYYSDDIYPNGVMEITDENSIKVVQAGCK